MMNGRRINVFRNSNSLESFDTDVEPIIKRESGFVLNMIHTVCPFLVARCPMNGADDWGSNDDRAVGSSLDETVDGS